MIDRKQIEGQLKSLDEQEQQAVAQLHQVRGAQRVCRHLLGIMDRQEKERMERSAPVEQAALEAVANGVAGVAAH